ncbi:MAG: hypothetical protein CMF69_07525 [Magnetovibrio sp.]|nr:hypothetical protein [Magnetovibrio sp.]
MNNMPEIFLVRHGETMWNRIGRHQGQLESVLTLEGIRQAKSVGLQLKQQIKEWDTIHLFCSPLFRCRQTAAVISDVAGINFEQFIYDERLKERCFGSWEGLTDEEIIVQHSNDWAMRQRDPWNYIIPGGGENYPSLATRVGNWLDEQEINSRILLVSHGQTGRVLRFLYLGLSPLEALNLPVPQNIAYRLFEGESKSLAVE